MITLTEQALDKIKQLKIKRGASVGLRIGVKTTGCSGLAYTLEWLNYPDSFDPSEERIIYPDFIIKIYTRHLPYILGTTVDYVRNGLNEGFEFRNPNERDRCGCGESFRV
jgi:iron-sulfur cluster assembly protein